MTKSTDFLIYFIFFLCYAINQQGNANLLWRLFCQVVVVLISDANKLMKMAKIFLSAFWECGAYNLVIELAARICRAGGFSQLPTKWYPLNTRHNKKQVTITFFPHKKWQIIFVANSIYCVVFFVFICIGHLVRRCIHWPLHMSLWSPLYGRNNNVRSDRVNFLRILDAATATFYIAPLCNSSWTPSQKAC